MCESEKMFKSTKKKGKRGSMNTKEYRLLTKLESIHDVLSFLLEFYRLHS
jgi:hypothetical protein